MAKFSTFKFGDGTKFGMGTSLSPSISPSTSPGWIGYTRGNYAVLPTDDEDLEVVYSDQDVIDVGSDNNVRVSQSGSKEFIIHEFKEYVDKFSCSIECNLQTDLAPTISIVKIQIYNRVTTVWDDVTTNSIAGAGSDFSMTGSIPNLTSYRDGDNVVSFRVYQEAK